MTQSHVSFHTFHFPTEIHTPPPLEKKSKTMQSIHVFKENIYLYLAILTTHLENQRVSGSASSDHLFINSLLKKKSITKHCYFFRGELQR